MHETDHEDLFNLMQLENTIKECSQRLIENIRNEAELQIILLNELKNYPNIKETLSEKNKFIQLKIKSNNEVSDYVDTWIQAQATIKCLKIMLQQVQGQRDSLKKKISLTPN